MENKNNCLICGADLVYDTTPQILSCVLCGEEFETTVACVNGHYICDDCHEKNGLELILEVCRNTKSKNPYEIMLHLMRQPSIFMHGPEHHVMVGSALLAAYENSGGSFGDRDRTQVLDEMFRRGRQVPGGVCGFWGCCGAGVSTGMYVSILLEATPLAKKEWGLANQMTSRALGAIGSLGGPRCCKRDSFTAVKEAVIFTEEHFGIKMELPEQMRCEFSAWNAQCKGTACPYHGGEHK